MKSNARIPRGTPPYGAIGMAAFNRLGAIGIVFLLLLAGGLSENVSGAGKGTLQSEKAASPATPASDMARLRVALYKGGGTGGPGPTNMMKYFNSGTNAVLVQVTPEQIQNGVLKGFQAVIFGGGSGSKEAETLGETGRVQVVEFIRNGGGYIGICAGAYLGTSGFPWSLHVLNAKTASPKWRRGEGIVKIELTEQGRTILGDMPGLLDIKYDNGPILKPMGLADIEDFVPLAYYRTELAENDTPKGLMAGSPAIVAGHFGKGRVICISPHPEQTKGLESFVEKALYWAVPAGAQTSAVP